MGREDALDTSPGWLHQRLWERCAWLRLRIGGEGPPGRHVEAQDEYLRLDRLDIPPEEKLARLRAWLEERTSGAVVEQELERFRGVTLRFDGPERRPPVKRQRLTVADADTRPPDVPPRSADSARTPGPRPASAP